MKYGQNILEFNDQSKSVNQIKRCLIITCNRYYTTSSKGDIIICSTAAPRTIYDDMGQQLAPFHRSQPLGTRRVTLTNVNYKFVKETG